jgi:C_GCAxxG_C_C family probable redox protein
MVSRVNEVLKCFQSGFDCSQAILSTYCEDFGLDKQTALKLSCGLAAGMSRLGETCGAVTGAYLLIGLKYGKYLPDDVQAKEKTFERIQEFERRFVACNQSTNCRELLGFDLRSCNKETALPVIQKICPKLVECAAKIVESILE